MAVGEKYILGNARFVEIPVNDLFVDKKYQRELNEVAVKRMVANYDTNLFEPPTINDRSEWDGYKGPRFTLIDGQHRKAVAKKMGFTTITCRVVSVHPEMEANLFVELNRQRIWLAPIAAWKAELTAGNPAAVEIKACLDARGLRVMNQNEKTRENANSVAAISSMKKIYARGGTVGLGRTLDVVLTTWDEDEGSRFNGNLLTGIHKFISKNPKVDIEKLGQKLSRLTPTQLLAKSSARYYAWKSLGTTHKGVVDAIADEIGKAYRRSSW